MTVDSTENLEFFQLFSSQFEEAFNQGHSCQLTQRRNPNLANLLNSERKFCYLQIVYRILRFRRDHELEPLDEDIFDAVRLAQEAVTEEEYNRDLFGRDMRQLEEWELLSCRIEKERLRGYRDTRRRKYRYRLAEDTIAFLEWLESKLQADLEDKVDDSGNLLFDVKSRLDELLKAIKRFRLKDNDVTVARSIIYLLVQLNDLTTRMNLRLSDMNADILGFLFGVYEVEKVKVIIRELEYYVETYLKRVAVLRMSLLPVLSQLSEERNQKKFQLCLEILEQERRNTPNLLRANRQLIDPQTIISRLKDYYRDNGGLDKLCHRLNNSYLQVYRRLKAHLRELERKNNRIEDIGARLKELAALPEEATCEDFFAGLLSHANMVFDPNYWNEGEMAEPPQPRRQVDQKRQEPKVSLSKKRQSSENTRSIREAKLERLRSWLDDKVIPAGQGEAGLLDGNFSEFDDLRRIFDTSRNGLLQKGRNLQRIGFKTEVDTDLGKAEAEQGTLEMRKTKIKRI